MRRPRRFISMFIRTFKRRLTRTIPEYVRPVKGCIFKCDLGILLEHTGVYIGNNEIVSLNRHGTIRVENPVSFFPPGTNPESNDIYAACYEGTDEVLCAPFVWKRAKKRVNEKSEYNMLFNNCHRFTTGCITGNFENDVVSFAQLEEVISAYLPYLRKKKPWWLRLRDFVLRREEEDLPHTFNWRPVEFDKFDI